MKSNAFARPARIPAWIVLNCLATGLLGCDPAPTPPPDAGPTTASTTEPLADPAAADDTARRARRAADLDAQKRERIALIAIPFTIEAPKSWLVQASAGNKIVLHGMTPSGELDVLLFKGPTLTRAARDALLKQTSMTAPPTTNAATTSAAASNSSTIASSAGIAPIEVRREVSAHDGIDIIKRVEVQSAPVGDPELVAIQWNMTCIVPGTGVDFDVYELSVIGLSKAMFDHDERFIQSILDTLRLDSASTKPAVP